MDQLDTDLYKTILPWICFKFALRQILKKTIHLHLRRIQLQIWNLHQIHDKLALHANLQIRIIFAVAANIPVIAAFAPSHPLQIRCEFINLQGCKYGKDDRIWNLHHICRYICTNAKVYFHPVHTPPPQKSGSNGSYITTQVKYQCLIWQADYYSQQYINLILPCIWATTV